MSVNPELNAEDGTAIPFTMSRELLAELGHWSRPVQVKVVATPGVGTGYEMIARAVEPQPDWVLE